MKLKLNTIVMYVSVVLVITWILMMYKRAEGYDMSEVDAYIIKQNVLDPNVIRKMASKHVSDQKKLDMLYTLATKDDRLGLFKLTAELEAQ